MLGPGRGNARPCIGALRMATSTLLFRGSTHVEEPTPHQMHQISDIPPAWFVSSVRASNLRGGRGSINFKRLLWLLLISQIEWKMCACKATQSEVRFAGIANGSCCQYQAVTAGLVPLYFGNYRTVGTNRRYGRHRTVFTTGTAVVARVCRSVM